MGLGRAGATGTPNAVPSLEAGPLVQGSLPGGVGLPPAAAGRLQRLPTLTSPYLVPECGAGMLSLLTVTPNGNGYCPIAVELWPFLHSASFSLHSGTHPLWHDGCGLLILGSLKQANRGPSQVGGS